MPLETFGLRLETKRVQDLLDKIENAAAAHLSARPDGSVLEKLDGYKTFLKVETHRLKMQHRAGLGGCKVCRARATILDVLLRHLWESARSTLSAM